MLDRIIGDDTEIELDLAAEPLVIMADRVPLEQVIINLVVYARDAIESLVPPATSLRIHVATRSVVRESVFAAAEFNLTEQQFVEIEVSDTGCGMEADTLSRITVLQFAREMLIAAGYSVITAHDGQEALETFEQEGGDFDLVIADVIMPRLSGVDPARA